MEIWPKKTFFGLDKNKAHCFTLPKLVTQQMIDHFELEYGNLQRKLIFIIGGSEFEAEIRMVIMDRSNVRKLQPEELPSRTVVQFQWKSYPDTQDEIRHGMAESYNLIKIGKTNDIESIIFTHQKMNRYHVEFNRKSKPTIEVRIG